MAKERFFTVDATSQYRIVSKQIKNLEDAPDDFMTREEMIETFGLDPDVRFFDGEIILEHKIKEQLSMWVDRLRASGKKSIEVTDSDLIEVIKTSYNPVSYYYAGLVRSGNKLSFAVAKPRRVKATKPDVLRLVGMIAYQHYRKTRVELTFKYVANNYEAAVLTAKAIVGKWESIDWTLIRYTESDIARMKQVWDNPSMFNKPVDQPA